MKSISIQDVLLNQLQIPTQLLSTYKSIGLNETEVMVILQIHRFLLEGTDFPTPMEISSYLTIDEKNCSDTLRKLLQKGFLSIEELENEHDQLSEAYSLEPLWSKLFTDEEPSPKEENHIGAIFVLFEQEFGRPLSPFEIERINSWIDDDEIIPALIKAGLREAVLMGKLNFNYIDRILRDWKKKGIHSVEQARESSKAFRDRQVQKKYNTTKKRDKSLYYNWLEEDN